MSTIGLLLSLAVLWAFGAAAWLAWIIVSGIRSESVLPAVVAFGFFAALSSLAAGLGLTLWERKQ